MSRAYRITVRESLNRQLEAADEICTTLEILQILPGEQMAKLLEQELERRGFKEKGGKMVREDEAITITIDPKTGELAVRSEGEQKMELEAKRDDRGYDDIGPSEEQIRRRLSETLKGDLECAGQSGPGAIATGGHRETRKGVGGSPERDGGSDQPSHRRGAQTQSGINGRDQGNDRRPRERIAYD